VTPAFPLNVEILMNVVDGGLTRSRQGYDAPANKIDVSNSTPGVGDPPTGRRLYYRGVAYLRGGALSYRDQ